MKAAATAVVKKNADEQTRERLEALMSQDFERTWPLSDLWASEMEVPIELLRKSARNI